MLGSHFVILTRTNTCHPVCTPQGSLAPDPDLVSVWMCSRLLLWLSGIHLPDGLCICVCGCNIIIRDQQEGICHHQVTGCLSTA